MSPAKLQTLLQNAVAHHRAGRLAEAEDLYRQVRVGAPKNFDALHLSGFLAYQQGRMSEAAELLLRAHRVDSKHSVCELRLAAALTALRRLPDAEKHLRHAVQVKPDYHEAWDALGVCLRNQDRVHEAVAALNKAVEVKPDFAQGWVNLGFTVRILGHHAVALGCHKRALAVDPNFVAARFGIAQAYQQLHRIPEAVTAYDAYLELAPQAFEARSNRLFALHYLDGLSREQVFQEHVAYGQLLPQVPGPTFANVAEPERRLKVAILSPDLRDHACAYFIEPLLAHLEREDFEVHLFHDHFREDAVSARLKALAAGWQNVHGFSADGLEQVLRAAAPDILIECAGHTGVKNRLPVLHRRVAPVQLSYLGYPDTTGVKAIDFRFTDAVADPVGEADALATETLVRFAPTAWSYAPLAAAPAVEAPPCLTQGYVTFGSFNDLAKITDTTLIVWGRVLAAVPNSRLRLKGMGLTEAEARARMAQRLTAAGIPVERVELLDRTPDAKSHLALYHGVDIALDAFPYNGTTTTCEALWMGVPVVILQGDRHVSRVGVSLMTALGRADWIAKDVDDYVRLAAEWAQRPAELAALRASSREEMQRSPLLDHAGQAERFGAALRQCWKTWCEQNAAVAIGLS